MDWNCTKIPVSWICHHMKILFRILFALKFRTLVSIWKTLLEWVCFNKWTINFTWPITISSVELKTIWTLNIWESNTIWAKIKWRTSIWGSKFSIFWASWFRVIDGVLAFGITIKGCFDWLWIDWKNWIDQKGSWVNVNRLIIFQLTLPETCSIDFVKLSWRCQIRVELLSTLNFTWNLMWNNHGTSWRPRA